MSKDKINLEILKILVLATQPDQGDLIEAGLKSAGIQSSTQTCLPTKAPAELLSGIDAFIIALSSGNDAELTNVIALAKTADCPVALFLDSGINANIGEIIGAGICTVVIDGLSPDRIPHILEATIHRYNKVRGLQIQLENAKTELEERKLVERAKAILIEQRQISEPTAYKLLQRAAMNQNCRIANIAQTIIVANQV